MKTSVETCMIYKWAVISWSSMKKPLLIGSLPLVHFLLPGCIRSIENWILDSLYLYNWVTAACLLESSLDVLVFLCIFWRIQLIKMYGLFVTLRILWLRSPVIWYLDTCKSINKIFVKSAQSFYTKTRMYLIQHQIEGCLVARALEQSKGTQGFLKHPHPLWVYLSAVVT